MKIVFWSHFCFIVFVFTTWVCNRDHIRQLGSTCWSEHTHAVLLCYYSVSELEIDGSGLKECQNIQNMKIYILSNIALRVFNRLICSLPACEKKMMSSLKERPLTSQGNSFLKLLASNLLPDSVSHRRWPLEWSCCHSTYIMCCSLKMYAQQKRVASCQLEQL